MTEGPKLLSCENWMTPDPAFEKTAGIAVEECMAIAKALMNKGPGEWNLETLDAPQVSPADWIRKVTRHRLSHSVPSDVGRLFEGAVGILAYGCFYYPLSTLAMEQLLRVLEAGVTAKCVTARGQGLKNTFHEKLEWLRDAGIITETRWQEWNHLRTLRNGSSHPQHQMLLTPAMCDFAFASICNDLNQLFSPKECPSP